MVDVVVVVVVDVVDVVVVDVVDVVVVDVVVGALVVVGRVVVGVLTVVVDALAPEVARCGEPVGEQAHLDRRLPDRAHRSPARALPTGTS